MPESYSDYLAINLLNEGQTVTYRSLSRALKVHSNVAKQMLYCYHQAQLSKKPGSLHATYLLTGRQRVRNRQNAVDGTGKGGKEDTYMQSSPLPESSIPEPHENGHQEDSWIKLVTLAKEERLQDAKANFDELSSIHIYSLEPGTINDLEVLSECNRKIAVEFASEDPLEVWKQYGTIQNANVTRRTGRRPPPPPQAASMSMPKSRTAKSVPTKQDAATVTSKTTKAIKDASKAVVDSQSAAVDSAADSEQKPNTLSRKNSAAKPPTVKREVSSIFKSFAKAKPKLHKSVTDDSTEHSPVQTPVEDEVMGGLSDEEAGDEDAAMLDEGALDAPAATEDAPTGKSKKEREEELRLMMEADDEPMEDDSNEPAASATPTTEKEDPHATKEPGPTETVTVSDGRRRGRRRVLKKKTVKDEEGYLVTKEEPGWESFSEDEPAPKKLKTTGPIAAAVKAKKGAAGKAGQGNIMSFFKKA